MERSGCFADLALGLTASQGGFYQSSYHFHGFKEENAPPGGTSHDCSESALDKLDLLQRGLKLNKLLF